MTPLPPPRLAVVVPCYNEEDFLPETARQLDNLVQQLVLADKINRDSYICFVDDGSRSEHGRSSSTSTGVTRRSEAYACRVTGGIKTR